MIIVISFGMASASLLGYAEYLIITTYNVITLKSFIIVTKIGQIKTT